MGRLVGGRYSIGGPLPGTRSHTVPAATEHSPRSSRHEAVATKQSSRSNPGQGGPGRYLAAEDAVLFDSDFDEESLLLSDLPFEPDLPFSERESVR